MILFTTDYLKQFQPGSSSLLELEQVELRNGVGYFILLLRDLEHDPDSGPGEGAL